MKLILVFLLLVAAQSLFAQTHKLQKIWESKDNQVTCESVLYFETENVLFVSNINGSPSEKDSNGYISKFSPDGKLIELEWATGLNAPKGACIVGKYLYVTDIDRLVMIRLRDGKIVNHFPVKGAQFLNDVTCDNHGNIYFGDSSGGNSKIYKYVKGKISVFLEAPKVSSPNGLFYKDGQLYFGNSGEQKIKSINLKSGIIEDFAFAGSGIDGLKMIAGDTFIISDWRGNTAIIKKGESKHSILNTTNQQINSADLEFIPKSNLVIIPTFLGNKIVCYKLTSLN